MAKSKFTIRKLFSEWVIGLILTLLMIAGYWFEWRPLMVLEYKAYDLMASMKAKPQVEAPVAIIAIDEGSIASIGRWPWPRRIMAEMVDLLVSYGVKAIGINVLYTESLVDPGQQEIRAVIKQIEELPSFEQGGDLLKVFFTLKASEKRLNNDERFAESIGFAENVVLPMVFNIEERLDENPVNFKDYEKASSMAATSADADYITATQVLMPIEEFASKAAGLGHTNVESDKDGTVRREYLLVDYGGRLFPSFSLRLVMQYLGIAPDSVNVDGGINVGRKIQIPADDKNRLLIKYSQRYDQSGNQTFKYYPFSAVLNELVPAEEFEGKIVLIGTTAAGIGSLFVTPIGNNYPPIEMEANIIENILSREFLTRPSWAMYLELGVLVLFGIFVSLLIPRLKAEISAVIALLLLALWSGIAGYLFIGMGMWIMAATPVMLLGVGYIATVTKRFMVTEKKKDVMEADSVETNKLLGLSFQGQGMLDMALDKFMKCPIEDLSIKEHMYNLGLDFERKRQFNKAVSVYEHILTDGPFKDLETRIKKLTAVGETMIFGTGGARGGSLDGTMVMDGSGEKPKLGRYEIERELGRGAMGVVYLGKDPKINRQVAIKTVRLDEIEEDQIADVKERFFREAEAAGKLSHPNIVTIYDAGEEHDLAYVAMELLEGMDLQEYCKKLGKLMPIPNVLRIVAFCADAIDYAHKNGVVHRDIKPANIMINKKGAVKVTDFGIARVIETSKTQTGVVLGTPSYMSPEQVIGKKVDGRSDLFSLGVMFYELLTGEKPFTGDSMATLMYNIANMPHPPIQQKKPDLPDCVVKCVDKFLQKDREQRYQNGAEAMRDLKMCYKMIGKQA